MTRVSESAACVARLLRPVEPSRRSGSGVSASPRRARCRNLLLTCNLTTLRSKVACSGCCLFSSPSGIFLKRVVPVSRSLLAQAARMPGVEA